MRDKTKKKGRKEGTATEKKDKTKGRDKEK